MFYIQISCKNTADPRRYERYSRNNFNQLFEANPHEENMYGVFLNRLCIVFLLLLSWLLLLQQCSKLWERTATLSWNQFQKRTLISLIINLRFHRLYKSSIKYLEKARQTCKERSTLNRMMGPQRTWFLSTGHCKLPWQDKVGSGSWNVNCTLNFPFM